MIGYKKLTEHYLQYQSDNPISGQPAELYNPANYILGLGGKRVRPLMVLLGYQLLKDDFRAALPLAHAVEVFHNFTLMHDDIMDQAEVRRGQPTVHVKWNENVGILSGDLMLVQSFRILSDLNTSSEVRERLVREFGLMAEEVCVGQQMDMNFESREQVEEDEYIEMIRLKTSVLLAYSLRAGAVLAGASDKDVDTLYSYGLNIGLAFQIRDDYLDTFGDAASFGKKIGGDILENKKTLLWIEANKRASDEQRKILHAWFGKNDQPEQKIKEVTQLFADLDVDQFAKNKMEQYFQRAEADLSRLDVSIRTENLVQLANDLQQRTS